VAGGPIDCLFSAESEMTIFDEYTACVADSGSGEVSGDDLNPVDDILNPDDDGEDDDAAITAVAPLAAVFIAAAAALW
jgi:hypothetical protein